jgi:DNA-directed RNA polymerase specialized sigma24 family protein
MISDSNFKMIKALNQRKYDPTKGNPFAYFTKICCRAFINVIKKEKRVSDTVSRYQLEIYDELALKGLSLNMHDNAHGDDVDE